MPIHDERSVVADFDDEKAIQDPQAIGIPQHLRGR
jgi:hypothetical protein